MVKATCPACGKTFSIPPKLEGTRGKCPCGQAFTLPTSGQPSPPQPPRPAPAQPVSNSGVSFTGRVAYNAPPMRDRRRPIVVGMVAMLAVITVPNLYGLVRSILADGSILTDPFAWTIIAALVGLNIFATIACRNGYRGKGRWFGPAMGASLCFALIVGMLAMALARFPAEYLPLSPYVMWACIAVSLLLPPVVILWRKRRRRATAKQKFWPRVIGGGLLGLLCVGMAGWCNYSAIVGAAMVVRDFRLEMHLREVSSRRRMAYSDRQYSDGPHAAQGEPDAPDATDLSTDVVFVLDYLGREYISGYDSLTTEQQYERIEATWGEINLGEPELTLAWYPTPIEPAGTYWVDMSSGPVRRLDPAEFQAMLAKLKADFDPAIYVRPEDRTGDERDRRYLD